MSRGNICALFDRSKMAGVEGKSHGSLYKTQLNTSNIKVRLRLVTRSNFISKKKNTLYTFVLETLL